MEKTLKLRLDIELYARELERYLEEQYQEGWQLSRMEGRKLYWERRSGAEEEEPQFLVEALLSAREAKMEKHAAMRGSEGWRYRCSWWNLIVFQGAAGLAKPDEKSVCRMRRRLEGRAVLAAISVWLGAFVGTISAILIFGGSWTKNIETIFLYLAGIVFFAFGAIFANCARRICDAHFSRRGEKQLRGRIWHAGKWSPTLWGMIGIVLMLLSIPYWEGMGSAIVPKEPPYSLEEVYGVEAETSFDDVSVLSLAGIMETFMQGGGEPRIHISMKIWNLRCEWLARADTVYFLDLEAKEVRKGSDAMRVKRVELEMEALSQEALDDLNLDAAWLGVKQNGDLALIYRDGATLVSLHFPAEDFQPGSPMYEAVKSRAA